jgi:hypothetical protein
MLQNATCHAYNLCVAILHVRGIPETLYKRAQRIAEKRGQSLSQLVIESLGRMDEEDAARRRHLKLLSEIRRNIEKRQRDWPTGLPDAVETIRDIREDSAALIPGG